MIVLGPCSPSDRVVGVKLDTLASLFLWDDLKTIIVDKHVGRATLQLVRGNGRLDGLDRGLDDRLETFLVHRALNGNVR